MRDFLVFLTLSGALSACAVANSSHAQQSRTPVARQQQPESAQPSPQQRVARPRPSGEGETQDALAFTGRLVREKGRILLKDPVTKMIYQLDDASKAKPFLGKQVRVIGKLNLDSNLIHVNSIAPTS
jgi:hypothetical protein